MSGALKDDGELLMVVILMGVSGSGKTTVGRILARDLGWPFFEGDDFHPQANIDKMARGKALTDEDRRPWLAAIGRQIDALLARGEDAVMACSALKQAYRDRLKAGRACVRFVYLQGSLELIQERLKERRGHYMKAELLASQFQALEEPLGALTVDIRQAPEVIARAIVRALDL